HAAQIRVQDSAGRRRPSRVGGSQGRDHRRAPPPDTIGGQPRPPIHAIRAPRLLLRVSKSGCAQRFGPADGFAKSPTEERASRADRRRAGDAQLESLDNSETEEIESDTMPAGAGGCPVTLIVMRVQLTP